MGIGLFTREQVKQGNQAGGKKIALKHVNVERLHEIGVKGVAKMNPRAEHPDMPATGAKRSLVYMLGEAPGRNEDEQGVQFVGDSGKLLRQHIPKRFADKLRWNNVVRTRPPKNRKPHPHEIECFRPSLIEDIERSKPRAIAGFGAVPLAWMLGSTRGIKVCRGRRFPVRIGKHVCWYYPLLHPSYILHVKEENKRDDKIPGREWERAFVHDVRRMFDEVETLADPVVDDPATFTEGVEWVTGKKGDAQKIVRFLDEMSREKRTGIDIETNRRKPYAEGARILSIAVGTERRVLAFPYDHPRVQWSRDDKRLIFAAVRKFLCSAVEKIAHNAAFEMEWLGHEFGVWRILRRCVWHCTQVQSYVIDERMGGQSLNFLTMLHFGLRLKEQLRVKTKGDLFGVDVESESEVDRSKLEEVEVEDLLKYNGGDAKYCFKLQHAQHALIKSERLKHVYKRQMRRLPSLVIAQHKGLPVDAKRVEHFDNRFDREITKLLSRIANLKLVRKYEKRFGKFNPMAPKEVGVLLRDICHRKELDGKLSTREFILDQMKDIPLVPLVLKLRKAAKNKSTYVDPLNARTKDSVVFPDGRIHCTFNTTFTTSGRLSAEDPNVQNFPMRKMAEVRSMIAAMSSLYKGEELVMVAADYAALEARVIAMASCDPVLVDALWTDYDIHMVWAEKIASVHDRRYVKLGSDMKKFRAEVKNRFVFPAFYGSMASSIASNLEMPLRLFEPLYNEFWEMFKRVRKWQKTLDRFYLDHFYVECLTGRRRRGPLSGNQVINSPIQGTASDLVVDAMDRLSEHAQEHEIHCLSPNMNIHDDLTLIMPKHRLEDRLEIVVREMTRVSEPFINVPVVIELKVGSNWHEMKEIGKYSSVDVHNHLRN